MSEVLQRWTPRDVLRVVFRRWHLFLIGASVFAVAAIYWAHYWPLSYTGTAIFERRLDPAGRDFKPEIFGDLKRTLIHRVRGREAVEQVIEELGLTQGLPHGPDGRLTLSGNMAKQQLVAEFQGKLQVRFQVESTNIDLVSVGFTHEDPELASKVPNALVSNYMEWVHKSIHARLEASSQFLAGQAAKCKNRLDELEQQKTDFEVKHAGMFPDSPDALQTRINDIHSDLDTLRLQQKRAKKEQARLESLAGVADQSTSEEVEEISQIELEYARLQARLLFMQEKLDAALLEYTERHPTVKRLRANIGWLKASMAELKPKLPAESSAGAYGRPGPKPEDVRTALAAARSEVEIATAEIERLENRLKAYENLMASFSAVRHQYLEIRRKISEEQAKTADWKTRLNGIQMSLQLEAAKRRTRLESVQTAEKQFRPSSPKLTMILGVAIFGGLGFGSGLVLLFNFLDRSVTTTEEATKYFNVPVQGVIGEIVTAKQKLRIKMKRYVLGPVIALVVLCTLAFSGLSITLYLKAPETLYKEWRDGRATFVKKRTKTLMDAVWQRIRS